MIHDQLPIHRTGVKLLALAVRVQVQLPRHVKHMLGEKIMAHCVEMLDLMALANASQREERAMYIKTLLKEQRAASVLLRVCYDARYLTAPKLWAESMEVLGSVGSQAGGWLKKTSNRAPAA